MNYYSDKAIRKWESLYTGRTTYSGQLGGTHTLQEDINKVDWTAGYAFAAYREPDRKIVNSILDETKTDLPNYYVSDPMRYYQDLKDHGVSLAANYEHKFTVSDSSPLFLTVVSMENIRVVRSMLADSVTIC